MEDGLDRNYQRPQPVTSAQPPLFILADDLTGACDAAVAFTSHFDHVSVQIDGNWSKSIRIQAITTESRDLAAADAEACIRSIAERLPCDAELFKKIDSTFRGNTSVEIAALLRHARFDLAILAPAYPALGRTVRDGVLHIRDSSGDRTMPTADLLANCGCSLTTLPTGFSFDDLKAAMHSRGSAPVVLCDTSTQNDLEWVVRAARRLARKVLWIGSGGLAHALAAELPLLPSRPAPVLRPGHTIFLIGTPHPVTRAQVEYLQRTTQINEDHSEALHSPAIELLVHVKLNKTGADDIRRAVSRHDPLQIGCLFMTGGDTAHFVCRELGIQALRLESEFAPGVPLAVAEGGPFDGVPVVLKSGGFGEPDLLYRLLETCRPEVTA